MLIIHFSIRTYFFLTISSRSHVLLSSHLKVKPFFVLPFKLSSFSCIFHTSFVLLHFHVLSCTVLADCILLFFFFINGVFTGRSFQKISICRFTFCFHLWVWFCGCCCCCWCCSCGWREWCCHGSCISSFNFHGLYRYSFPLYSWSSFL